jgi:hypothetical protein
MLRGYSHFCAKSIRTCTLIFVARHFLSTTLTMDLKEQHLLQNGTITSREFSFDSATFERNLKANLQFHTYDKANPATWPLITLDVIGAHYYGEYTGAQLLPPHVAYSAAFIERLFKKHTKKELKIPPQAAPRAAIRAISANETLGRCSLA